MIAYALRGLPLAALLSGLLALLFWFGGSELPREMSVAGLPYWGYVAAFFVTAWGTFTLAEGMDAAWSRVSDRP